MSVVTVAECGCCIGDPFIEGAPRGAVDGALRCFVGMVERYIEPPAVREANGEERVAGRFAAVVATEPAAKRDNDVGD